MNDRFFTFKWRKEDILNKPRLLISLFLVSTILFIGCAADNGSSREKETSARQDSTIKNTDSSTIIDTNTSQKPKFEIGNIVSIPVRKNVGLYKDPPVFIKDTLLNDGSYKISDSNWCTLWFTKAQKFRVIEVVNIMKRQSDNSIIKYLMKMNKDYGQLYWYRIQAIDTASEDKCIDGYIEEERLSLSTKN